MYAEHNDERAVFKAALKIKSPTERAAYLKKACVSDAELLARVEALLKAHDEAGSFLEVPAIDRNATLDNPPLFEGPGTKIGRYELLELIGEGGMGLVYLAEQQEPLRRRVALKIVKLGMDTKQVIARFEAERQTLAVLDHPNIAHVFDAGTTDTGRPYFVMEYVRGMSITRYCDEHRLDVEQRLRLFQEVCEGVHHAHQKGIIHRDIKPSNILVSIHGDKAVPKIIDFGIAKAITQPLTEETFFTHEGQLLGTPEYMSPEQVDLATQDIDTRSDIYSLGVVLYELLAGVLPFERESLHKIGFAELQRTLRELEPASPSIRLANLGEQAKAIADSRMTQVVPLARRLHRELEWIPLKAMRKDRCRRYKSASDMADDIQSYLNGNPLLAGPETAMYRVQKFVHKHAGSVATAALVSVALIIGLVVSIMMGCRAEQARQKEVLARKQVEQALMRAEKAERIAQEQRKLAEERAEAYRWAMYSNNLALAKEAIDEGSFIRSQKLLNSCEPELRGWEWQHLRYISDQPIKTFRLDKANANSVAVSPDGKHIVTGSDDKTIKVWDAASGTELKTVRGHKDKVGPVSFSPDGMKIVSGGRDNAIKVWDVATGNELMTLQGHKGGTCSVAFSPDGKLIVSSSTDKTVKVWDGSTGTELMTLVGHGNAAWSKVAFSPDGKRIASASTDASGSTDKTIKVWDVVTGNELMTLQGHERGVLSVAFSPDGKRIVSGSWDETIKIWDANTGDEEMTISGHTGSVMTVVFSPDGKRIVSGGWDETIKIWDANTGDEEMTITAHTGPVTTVVLSPDGRRVFSAGKDGVIGAWNPAFDQDVLRLHGSKSWINKVAFSPDGKCIAAATGEGVITLSDAVSGADIITLRGHIGYVQSIAFSPDGRQIVSGGNDKTVKVWNVATGALEMTLTGHTDRLFSVAFSPDGKRIVSCSQDETVMVRNAATGAMEMTLTGHKGVVFSVAFSPDGRRIVSAGNDGTVRIWDALSGTELLTLRGHETRDIYGFKGVLGSSVSPDGKRIASCGMDETVRIWDAATGVELMALHGHESPVWTVAFSPDGRRIVSGDYNREVKIWDAGTGTELMTLYGVSSNIRSVVFSPDGKSICVGGDDGNITLWESVEPAAGYGPRQIVKRARKTLDKLYEEHGLYSEVINKLKADQTLEESVRKIALQIANARLWEDEE